MPDIDGKFLNPLIALYGDLGTDDTDLVLDLYTKTLAGFADDVLEGGFAHVAGTYIPSKRNPWPSPAICKKACEKITGERQAKQAHKPEKPIYPEWEPSAIAVADNLIDCEMGRRAAREGWIVGLHDYCRKHHKLPSPYETGDMIANAKFVDRCAAGAVNMGAMHSALVGFAEAFLARRESLARKVLGEAA